MSKTIAPDLMHTSAEILQLCGFKSPDAQYSLLFGVMMDASPHDAQLREAPAHWVAQRIAWSLQRGLVLAAYDRYGSYCASVHLIRLARDAAGAKQLAEQGALVVSHFHAWPMQARRVLPSLLRQFDANHLALKGNHAPLEQHLHYERRLLRHQAQLASVQRSPAQPEAALPLVKTMARSDIERRKRMEGAAPPGSHEPPFLASAAAQDYFLPTCIRNTGSMLNLGRMAWAAHQALAWQDLNLMQVMLRLTHALSLRQVQFLRAGGWADALENGAGELQTYFSWAWLHEAQANACATAAFKPHDYPLYQWNEGRALVLCDLIAQPAAKAALLQKIAFDFYPELPLWLPVFGKKTNASQAESADAPLVLLRKYEANERGRILQDAGICVHTGGLK